MKVVLLLIIAAVLGNWLLRRALRHIEATPGAAAKLDYGDPTLCPVAVETILEEWARPSTVADLECTGPLHPSIVDCLKRFDRIQPPDGMLTVLDRNLISAAFKENERFVQIGIWGDGSEVVVRRDSEDPGIYLCDLEDGDPSAPQLLAGGIDDYLRVAWLYHEDALRAG